MTLTEMNEGWSTCGTSPRPRYYDDLIWPVIPIVGSTIYIAAPTQEKAMEHARHIHPSLVMAMGSHVTFVGDPRGLCLFR